MVNRIVLGVFVCWLILEGVFSQTCIDGCHSCSSLSNYCHVCKDGKYGDKCQWNCTFAEYCYRQLCDSTGLKCYYRCVEGRHGDRCDELCSPSCRNGCWYHNGACANCEQGKYGTYCENDCPDGCETGCQRDGSCRMPCTDRTNCYGNLCNGATGNCYNGCEYGWSGEDCNVPCPPNNCVDNRCDRYNTSKCDSDSRCLLGWYGEGCNLPCNLTNCASNCDKDTGRCLVCKTGFYGDLCESVCQVENCLYNCDRRSGECHSCTYKKYGNNCEKDCKGCYLNICHQTSGKCSVYYGDTEIYCKPGFYGEYCTKCQNRNCSTCNDGVECTSCNGGLYGTSCDKHCPFNCIHTDGAPECDMTTGVCLHGCYYGDGCVSSCQDIDKHCIDCSRTKIDTFLCIHCNDGYYTSPEGDMNGRRTCLPCGQCSSGTCPNDTGICPDPCGHGYWGERCDQTCLEGCMICEKKDGVCQLTYNQLDDYRSPSESSSMPYIVGGCVGGIGLAAIVVAIVIIVKARTMNRKQERAETSYHINLGQREEEYYSTVDAPLPEIPTQRTSNLETEGDYVNTGI